MMKDIKWMFNRLKSMNLQEIAWRVYQKSLQKKEQQEIYTLNLPVTNIPVPADIAHLHINIDCLSINWENKKWKAFEKINLFEVFDYCKYKNRWNAGFQTPNSWPEDVFSPLIDISQREDIGDIRTNWELNRHYQFAALAKTYYCTREEMYLNEFKELFMDWNEHNFFLHGAEWTSAMEIAIRANSWVYSFAFLKRAGCEGDILQNLEHGIIVMTNYIIKHRAMYSSANNHLIVEMYAVALVGIVTNYEPWKSLAIGILTEELQNQNYSDGVNKEMSLHYQSFIMEGYGLLCILMQKNQMKIPSEWTEYLSKMSEFICDSCGDFGEVVVFGDNDEGKILDLSGTITDHYTYVLDLMGLILSRRYSELAEIHENIMWITTEQSVRTCRKKNLYRSSTIRHYKLGGYTFLRSQDGKFLMGIDHAELGYRELAAHGHADALSFQLFLEGQPVFIDSGTGSYHVPSTDRNEFRSTKAHNTICIDEKNQAEMLGPFLCGKRYHLLDTEIEQIKNKIVLKTGITYENGDIHNRIFKISVEGEKSIEIQDKVWFAESAKSISQIYLLGKNCVLQDNIIRIGTYQLRITSSGISEISSAEFSEGYGKKGRSSRIVFSKMVENKKMMAINTIIKISMNSNWREE